MISVCEFVQDRHRLPEVASESESHADNNGVAVKKIELAYGRDGLWVSVDPRADVIEPRPRFRASARARSAAAMSSSPLAPSAGKRATPADTLMAPRSLSGRAAIPSTTLRATVTPAAPGATTTNSSPP